MAGLSFGTGAAIPAKVWSNLGLLGICLLVLVGCARAPAPVQCANPTEVAPNSIGGAQFLQGLTAKLAGGDRENTIVEAIGEIRHRDPALTNDAITDIIIAADCPNSAARAGHDDPAVRADLAALRAQVEPLVPQVQISIAREEGPNPPKPQPGTN